MRSLGTLAFTVWLVLISGCVVEDDRLRKIDRRRQLVAMAAEEALSIGDVAERLRRQLNIANTQIANGRFRDGRKTLGHARLSVETGQPTVNPHARLAGWVSISELSRKAGYDRYADAACQEAIQLLRSIQPVPARCEYVRGVAQEVLVSRGKQATAELLRESSAWVAEIADRDQRREAYIAIASDLFNCGDYTGGRNVLRCDGDARWRSEILTRLSKEVIPMEAYGKSVSFADFYYVKESEPDTTTEASGGRPDSAPATKPSAPKSNKTRESR